VVEELYQHFEWAVVMASDVSCSRVIVCVGVSLDYQAKGYVWVVQSECLSKVSADDAEEIVTERENRRGDVGEAMRVYELETREICRVPCTSAEVSPMIHLTHNSFSAAAAAARPPMP
jgi:hypothetical protein